MKLDDRLALIRAGYSKEEIQAMEESEQPDNPTTPAQPQNEQQEQKDQNITAAEVQPDPVQAPAQDPILEALNRLTNTIINQNINKTVMQPAERSPQDALAEIIAPPAKQKKGG